MEHPVGLVARAGHLDDLPVGEDLAHGHLILRERPGLVGADDGDASERLDRGQAADEHLPPDHPLCRQRERDRDHGRQRLGHDGDGERRAEEQHVQERFAAEQAEADDDDHENERRSRQQHSDPVEAQLQRGLAPLDRLQHPCDGAELGLHSGGDDDAATLAVRDGRSGVDHVRAVAELQLLTDEGGGLLLHRKRLAGQCRLLDLEGDDFAQARIRRRPVARAQQNDVARHELARRDVVFLPVPHHRSVRRRQLPERLDRPFGAVLLHESQHGREDDDDGDDHGFRRVPEHRRQAHRHEQDQDQDVLELGEQDLPRRDHVGGLQLVGAVGGQPPRGLLVAQARTGRGFELGRDIGDVHQVPGFRLTRAANGALRRDYRGEWSDQTPPKVGCTSFVGLSHP